MAHGFDEQSVRRIANTVLKSEADPRELLGNYDKLRSSGSSIHWQRGVNNSGGEIPAFAAVRLGSSSVLDGLSHASLLQPSATFTRSYGLTGREPIVAGDRGGYHEELWLARYDGSATPTVGEAWGPKPGQWELSKYYPGFVVRGVHNSELMLVKPEPINALVAKSGSPIAALDGDTPGIGTVTVHVFDGTDYVPTDWTVTADNLSAAEVAADVFLQLKWYAGRWLIDFESCPAR